MVRPEIQPTETAAIVHDVGYRGWSGQRTAQWSRWWIIAETGIKLVFKSRWVRRLLFFAWLPILYWGGFFFAAEQYIERVSDRLVLFQASREVNGQLLTEQQSRELRESGLEQLVNEFQTQFNMFPHVDRVAAAVRSGDKQLSRHTIWSWLLMTFLRYPQGTLVLFLLGFIAPSLIARDVRSRAFLLYFSRPIGRLDYVLGKLFIPATYVALISLAPAMALFIFAMAMSPNLSVFLHTWDLIPRIFAASLCLIIPTASLSLMLSSLTQESRFASFAWFAIWALGYGAWIAILFSQAIRLDRNPSEVLTDPLVDRWSVVSLYHNLCDVQSWVFGFEPFSEIWPSFVILASLTVFSIGILLRRVSSPIRI